MFETPALQDASNLQNKQIKKCVVEYILNVIICS